MAKIVVCTGTSLKMELKVMPASASVILCATPRSGSTLLCDLLAATGVCGVPESWFRRQSIDDFIAAFGLTTPKDAPAFDADYLAAAIKAGSDGSGTFGLRLMWPTVPELSDWLDRLHPGLGSDRARYERAFGPARYVYLSRHDHVAQAVSRLKAEQSGLWHLNQDGSERERVMPHKEPAYDGAALSHYVEESTMANRGWEAWFAQNGVSPFRLAYEDLAADPGSALVRVLAAIGRDPSFAGNAAPATAVLADETNRDWIARFRAEQDTMSADKAARGEPPLA
jgi:trehalose 2-sulfotransferase